MAICLPIFNTPDSFVIVYTEPANIKKMSGKFNIEISFKLKNTDFRLKKRVLEGDTQKKQQHADDDGRKQDSAPEMVSFERRVLILNIPAGLFPLLAGSGAKDDLDK
ncbi:MAG: hypothetical protein ACYSOZ_07355 [Planctomycetota bacterium]|jgi:hypothetical protein